MPLLKKRIEVVQLVDTTTKQPIKMDNKRYLLLLLDANEDKLGEGDTGEFITFYGRKMTYEYLVSNLGAFDLLNSFVLSDTMRFGSEVSIYSFMRLYIEKHMDGTEDEPITVDELNSYVNQTTSADVSNLDYDNFFFTETRRRAE